MHLTRLAAFVAVLLVLTGCALGQPAEVVSATPSLDATTTPSAEPTATPTVMVQTATPTPTPTPKPKAEASPKPEKAKPSFELSADQRAQFGGCTDKRVSAWSGGNCATLAQHALAEAGFLKGKVSKRIDVRGANAILNYQRSRGISATGTIDEATWHALATKKAARSSALPEACKAPGTVLCVDQGTRKLTYLVDGDVKKVVQVRLGGYAQHAKKKNWRNFPTANGNFKIYTKHRSPTSENYGSGVMPYSLIFDPNMYVHYSADFARRGYNTASHGCVNVGDKAAAMWLYKHTPIGARVHVF